MDINPMNPMEAMATLGRKTGQLMGPRPEPEVGDISPEEAAMKVKFFESQLGKKGVPAPPPEVVAKYEKYKKIAAGAPKQNEVQRKEFMDDSKIDPSTQAGSIVDRSLFKPGQTPEHTRDVIGAAREYGITPKAAEWSAVGVEQRKAKAEEPARQEKAEGDYFKSISRLQDAHDKWSTGRYDEVNLEDLGLTGKDGTRYLLAGQGADKDPAEVKRVAERIKGDLHKRVLELEKAIIKRYGLDPEQDADMIESIGDRVMETGQWPKNPKE